MQTCLSAQQRRTCENIIASALVRHNCTLSLVPRHKDPYHDYSAKQINRIDAAAKSALVRAIANQPVAAIISASPLIRETVAWDGAVVESRRQNVIRFQIRDPRWLETNWRIVSGEFEIGKDHRELHLFFQFTEESLKLLVRPWYDPSVFVNPSISSSPRMISEIKKRLVPGLLAFSVTHLRLTSAEIFFHPADIRKSITWVCESTRKTKWWR